MPFGNHDPIDKRNRERIRELEEELRTLTRAFENSTSLPQVEKWQTIRHARRVLGSGL